MKLKINLFLDSGAYSAWTRGVKISLQDYINFIKENEEYIEVYANLDDITSPERTWENQKEMERQGLKPLPVYHLGEPVKYLYKAMEYEYFGVGGLASASARIRKNFYDFVFGIVCPKENNYLPRNKIHGFGMTELRFMFYYPFYSVDSTSWVVSSGFGSVFVPRKVKGEYRYDIPPLKVAVSSRSPARKEEDQHISTMSDAEREEIFEYFMLKGYRMGKSEFREVPASYKLKPGERWFRKGSGNCEVELVVERGLCNDYRLRDELNIIYFRDLQENFPKWPWPFDKRKVGGFWNENFSCNLA